MFAKSWSVIVGRLYFFGPGRYLFGNGRYLYITGRYLLGTGRYLLGTGRYLFGPGRYLFGLGRCLAGSTRYTPTSFSLKFLTVLINCGSATRVLAQLSAREAPETSRYQTQDQKLIANQCVVTDQQHQIQTCSPYAS